jgi:hypothetical protein
MYKILFSKYWDNKGNAYHFSISIGKYNSLLEFDISRSKFSLSVLRLKFFLSDTPF